MMHTTCFLCVKNIHLLDNALIIYNLLSSNFLNINDIHLILRSDKLLSDNENVKITLSNRSVKDLTKLFKCIYIIFLFNYLNTVLHHLK